VEQDFAERADVRYTADAKTWCMMALGFADARDLVKRGLVTKDGGPAAMDQHFHQIYRANEDRPADADSSQSRDSAERSSK
jgi:hypothetical protein